MESFCISNVYPKFVAIAMLQSALKELNAELLTRIDVGDFDYAEGLIYYIKRTRKELQEIMEQ